MVCKCRRAVLAVLAVVASAALLPGVRGAGKPASRPSGQAATKPAALRVITYNIHAFGPVAPQEEGRKRIARVRASGQLMRRYAMELALHRPDVIALQEAAPKEQVEQLARQLKMHVAFFPGGWKNKGWPDGIAGALLSRFRIVESQDRPHLPPYRNKSDIFSRHFGRTLLDIGTERIAVYTAHLLPSWPKTTSIRLAEIKAVAAAARADRKRGHSVVVLGDMNHRPAAPEYRAWIDAGFTDAFAAKGRGSPLTCPCTQPVERIDYVFAVGPIAERLTECRVLREGAFRCHLGDATTWALSDHMPVLAVFE